MKHTKRSFYFFIGTCCILFCIHPINFFIPPSTASQSSNTFEIKEIPASPKLQKKPAVENNHTPIFDRPSNPLFCHNEDSPMPTNEYEREYPHDLSDYEEWDDFEDEEENYSKPKQSSKQSFYPSMYAPYSQISSTYNDSPQTYKTSDPSMHDLPSFVPSYEEAFSNIFSSPSSTMPSHQTRLMSDFSSQKIHENNLEKNKQIGMDLLKLQQKQLQKKKKKEQKTGKKKSDKKNKQNDKLLLQTFDDQAKINKGIQDVLHAFTQKLYALPAPQIIMPPPSHVTSIAETAKAPPPSHSQTQSEMHPLPVNNHFFKDLNSLSERGLGFDAIDGVFHGATGLGKYFSAKEKIVNGITQMAAGWMIPLLGAGEYVVDAMKDKLVEAWNYFTGSRPKYHKCDALERGWAELNAEMVDKLERFSEEEWHTFLQKRWEMESMHYSSFEEFLFAQYNLYRFTRFRLFAKTLPHWENNIDFLIRIATENKNIDKQKFSLFKEYRHNCNKFHKNKSGFLIELEREKEYLVNLKKGKCAEQNQKISEFTKQQEEQKQKWQAVIQKPSSAKPFSKEDDYEQELEKIYEEENRKKKELEVQHREYIQNRVWENGGFSPATVIPKTFLPSQKANEEYAVYTTLLPLFEQQKNAYESSHRELSHFYKQRIIASHYSLNSKLASLSRSYSAEFSSTLLENIFKNHKNLSSCEGTFLQHKFHGEIIEALQNAAEVETYQSSYLHAQALLPFVYYSLHTAYTLNKSHHNHLTFLFIDLSMSLLRIINSIFTLVSSSMLITDTLFDIILDKENSENMFLAEATKKAWEDFPKNSKKHSQSLTLLEQEYEDAIKIMIQICLAQATTLKDFYETTDSFMSILKEYSNNHIKCVEKEINYVAKLFQNKDVAPHLKESLKKEGCLGEFIDNAINLKSLLLPTEHLLSSFINELLIALNKSVREINGTYKDAAAKNLSHDKIVFKTPLEFAMEL